MIIESITIKSFGQLTDLTLSFSDGVNVLVGQNEAGKTTVAAFIKYMLYGFDAPSGEGAEDERARRVNWTSGTAEGSMTVRVGEKRYLITRSTVQTATAPRPTYREDCAITDMETGTPAFGRLPAGDVFFGVDRSLFENTAFIGQVGDASISGDSVRESIENILFSASEKINTQRAIDRVSEKMEDLLHAGGNGGTIYELIRKQEELEETLRRADEDNRRILTKEADLHEIRARKREAEEKREKLYDFDQCYRNVMVIQTFDKLHELESEAEEKAAAYQSFLAQNTRAGYVPNNQYLTDIALARKGVNDTYHELADAEEAYDREKRAVGITREIEGAIERSDEMGGEELNRTKAERLHTDLCRNIAAAVACALLAVAVVVTELALPSLIALARIGIAILGAAGLVGSVAMGLLFWQNKKRIDTVKEAYGTETYEELMSKLDVIAAAREKRDSMIRSTETARLAKERATVAHEQAKTELYRVIRRWGEEPPVTGMNEFLDGLESRVTAFLEEKRRLQEEKNSIEITVKEIRRTLADKSEIDIRAQVTPLKRKILSEINHDEIINGIADAKVRIAEQERLAFEVESELSALKVSARDPGELYSKIQALERRIADLRQQHKAYYIAVKAMENASADLRAEISPRLSSYAAELLSVMTDKKYESMDITEGIQLTFPVDGQPKSVDFLSGGTRDLAYIAARMALVDMLYREAPPVCFDESFAHQDNQRARSMMNAIVHLADQGVQSFIFTCREREAELVNRSEAPHAVFLLTSNREALA